MPSYQRLEWLVGKLVGWSSKIGMVGWFVGREFLEWLVGSLVVKDWNGWFIGRLVGCLRLKR